MKIECPICSIAIEVTEEHVGRKGRCDRCESKFIVPADPQDEVEILHRGEAPVEEQSVAKPLVVPAQNHRRRPQARSLVKTNDSPFGMIAMIGIFVLTLVGVLAFLNKDETPEPTKAPEVAKTTPTPSPPVEKPLPEPEPEKPAPVVLTEPEPEPVEVAVAESSPAPEPAEAAPQPPALTEEQKASALGFLKSNLANKRKSAYAGFRKLGDREKDTYLELLDLARAHHSELLGGRAFQLTVDKNPLSAFGESYDEWTSRRDSTKTLVQTNWKDKEPNDYKKRHAEMDKAFDEVAAAYEKTIRTAKRADSYEPSGMQALADALTEIRTEIAWAKDEAAPAPLSLSEEIADADGAERYVELISAIAEANTSAADREAVRDFNSKSSWASGAYKTFAEILNDRRVPLGLTPLRLDEQLSDACRDHSEDMAANGYFSHTGLTDETRTFSKRAKRANFSGFATGECIYVGSPSPEAAHRAWWYSDGHRLIMYAGNPNTLGLGLHGKHWTLNTGKK